MRRAHSNLMAQHVEIIRHREQLDTVLGAMRSLVVEVDDHGRILRLHPTAFPHRTLLPDRTDQLAGQPLTSLLPLADPEALPRMLAVSRRTATPQQAELEVLPERTALDAERLWFFVTVSAMDDSRQLLAARDMTALHEARRAVARQERLHAALVEHAADGVAVVDAEGTIAYLSPGVHAALGLKHEQLQGLSFETLLTEDEREAFLRQMAVVLPVPGKTARFEAKAHKADGSTVVFEIHAANLLHEPDVAGIVLNCRDITCQRRYQEELRRQAFSDPLTGLANRALFMDRLGHAMARMSRKETYSFAVLAIDLDRFKRVNESLGHDNGDQLLQRVAQILKGCMRRVDTLARLQGDDFVVLLDEIGDKLEVIRVAVRIRAALAQPLMVEGVELSLRSSIGIVYGDTGCTCPEQILRDAETALRWAKTHGDDGYKVFHATMHKQAMAQLEMETDIRKGLERNEFYLNYQPIVSLDTNLVVGMEALLRWTHPHRGVISPMQFIPVAEESGLIVPLGERVLELALAQAVRVREILGEQPFYVSVNLSPRQLVQKELTQMVRRALEQAGLPASVLKLEVTESLVMDNPAQARAILKELQSLGCRLAIDDFGTGYSSLSHLCQYPFDTLKIDRSFVSLLEESNLRHEGIVQAILHMAQSLEMHVVAEGIETPEQIETLTRLGCRTGQGYYFATPMDAAALEAFLTKTVCGKLPADAMDPAVESPASCAPLRRTPTAA
ncbi:EAL domain-containing protein [Megalodesulfovibrio paquesii]